MQIRIVPLIALVALASACKPASQKKDAGFDGGGGSGGGVGGGGVGGGGGGGGGVGGGGVGGGGVGGGGVGGGGVGGGGVGGGGVGGGGAAVGCFDNVKNGSETDIDCGGTCTANCALGKGCALASDCQTPSCVGGFCVACSVPAECPGSDTSCRVRTCVTNQCGVFSLDAGIVAGTQTPGDCRQSRCDGDGGLTLIVDDTDLPLNDGNACTGEVCTVGVVSHPATALDSPCTDGGIVCDGAGACVACNSASQCTGTNTECRTKACSSSHVCGFTFTAGGFITTAQISGDCRENQCDGDGGITGAIKNSDVPGDDGLECTSEGCSTGTPTHPALAIGVACTQDGGQACNGAGACDAPPNIAITVPGDGAAPLASTAIAVTFTTAMNPATLTAQTAAGACSGSIQVSRDGFTGCIGFSSAAAVMSNGGKTATFTPVPGLLVNNAYKLRVTTGPTSLSLLPLAAAFTQPAGFTTLSPNVCDGSLVISQVYGAGGNTGATYTNDFVELHNRGATAVALAGKSIQYASTAGTSWTALALTGTVAPGGYFLIQLSGGTIGAALPTPDQTGTISMAAAAGKVALMSATATNPTGLCSPAATTIDFVGFGTGTNCFEGTTFAPSPSVTTSDLRSTAGCADLNSNGADFIAGPVLPRNSAAAAATCACVARNESNAVLEADYCNVQFPLSLSVTTATASAPVYGQIFEAGVTEAADAGVGVRAQLGFGPATANPQYEPGWQWTNAIFNLQQTNNDEFEAVITAPAVGTYRYVYRMSVDNGVSWTYCDQNSGDFGAGSNSGVRFDFADEPVMTVVP